jgi:hypothetical protein
MNHYVLTSSLIASSSSSSSKVCPLYSGFPSPKTKFRHLSLSLVSSSVSPWSVMLRLTPSIHLSLSLPLLRVPSGVPIIKFSGSLFPGILFTCPNHRSRFSSVTSKCSSRPHENVLLWSLNKNNRKEPRVCQACKARRISEILIGNLTEGILGRPTRR